MCLCSDWPFSKLRARRDKEISATRRKERSIFKKFLIHNQRYVYLCGAFPYHRVVPFQHNKRTTIRTNHGSSQEKLNLSKCLRTITLYPTARHTDNNLTLNLNSKLLFVLKVHIAIDRVYNTSK